MEHIQEDLIGRRGRKPRGRNQPGKASLKKCLLSHDGDGEWDLGKRKAGDRRTAAGCEGAEGGKGQGVWSMLYRRLHGKR